MHALVVLPTDPHHSHQLQQPETPILPAHRHHVSGSGGGGGSGHTNNSSSNSNHLSAAHAAQQQSQHFRKRREKSAMILVSIVLTFIFCHTFRLVIQAYEVTHPSHSTAEHHDFCHKKGRYGFDSVQFSSVQLLYSE